MPGENTVDVLRFAVFFFSFYKFKQVSFVLLGLFQSLLVCFCSPH